jgi:hypothetical protein
MPDEAEMGSTLRILDIIFKSDKPGKPDVLKLHQENDVTGLLRALCHDDATVRKDAADALGDLGGDTAIPELSKKVNDVSPEVRVAASQALRRIKKGIVSVTFEVKVPLYTPRNESVCLAGSFNEWKPGEIRLAKGGQTLTLPLSDGSLVEYKYVRGTWDQREIMRTGEERENRTLSVKWSGKGLMAVSDEIECWSDQQSLQMSLLGDITEELGLGRLQDLSAFAPMREIEGVMDFSTDVSPRARHILSTYGINPSAFQDFYKREGYYSTTGPRHCLCLIGFSVMADAFSHDDSLEGIVSVLKYATKVYDRKTGYRRLASELLKASRHPKARSLYRVDPDKEFWYLPDD